jgi:ubiquinone biosynthesis protein
LDPDLDLWSTAKPFLERWMNDQVGWRALVRRFKDEAPLYAKFIPELPRLLHQRLESRTTSEPQTALLAALVKEQRRTNRLLATVIWCGLGFLLGAVGARLLIQLGHG